jgi:hypothetical protein
LRARVANASNELESLRQEGNRIDEDLVRIAAEILDPAITNEHRAQLLLDTKHLAERKGEIKASIPQREIDCEHYRRELEDYRAGLAYIE